MAEYAFRTTWCIDAPLEQVWNVIDAPSAYHEWWRGVAAVELLRSGDETGVGQISRFAWRGALPYTLRFDLRVTRVQPLLLIEAEATGELEGRGTWRLFAGLGTAVIFDWRVRTTMPWMNLLGPVGRSAFSWNHDLAMRRGAVGLAGKLRAPLLGHD